MVTLEEKLQTPASQPELQMLDVKLERIITLLERQERRAKIASLWKFVIFIFVFVIPTYLAFKMFNGANLVELTDSMKEFKSMIP